MRDGGRCQKCSGEGTDVHHRMRRRDGGHGMWNLVLLCRTCHSWAHANPEQARDQGYIISAFLRMEEASMVPLRDWNGTMRLLT